MVSRTHFGSRFNLFPLVKPVDGYDPKLVMAIALQDDTAIAQILNPGNAAEDLAIDRVLDKFGVLVATHRNLLNKPLELAIALYSKEASHKIITILASNFASLLNHMQKFSDDEIKAETVLKDALTAAKQFDETHTTLNQPVSDLILFGLENNPEMYELAKKTEEQSRVSFAAASA